MIDLRSSRALILASGCYFYSVHAGTNEVHEGFSAGSGMRRGSSPIPASQQGWNLADVLARCSGHLQGESFETSARFQTCCKLVLENYPFLLHYCMHYCVCMCS